MRTNIFFLLVILFKTALPNSVVKNVTFRYTGVQLIVNYDLESDKLTDLHTVRMEVFGGYDKLDATSQSGDVGENIKPGIGKTIVWNTKADNINFSGELFVKVIARLKTNVSVHSHVIKSILYPGLGNYRLDNGNWHFLYGLGGYGAALGSVLFNQQAASSYDNYTSSYNATDANKYFNQASAQLTTSYILAGSAVAIWGYSLYRTYAKAKRLNKSSVIKQSDSKYYFNKSTRESSASSISEFIEIKGIYYPPNLSFNKSNGIENEVGLLDNENNPITYLYATEGAKLVFEIENSGQGNARGVEVLVREANQLTGLDFLKLYQVGDINKNSRVKVEIPITTNINLKSSIANFVIDVKESNGFGVDPISLKVSTKEFLAPKIEVVDYRFLSEKGGEAKRGEKITLKVNIQNTGFGDAKNVSVDLKLPVKNVFPVNETQHQFKTFKSGEHVSVDLEFFTNKEYFDTTLSVDIQLQESWGRFAESKKVVVSLNQQLSKKELNILGDVSYNSIIKPALLTSDVDINIPQNNEKKPYRYAIVIGNEDYASRQPTLQTEANVDFAEQDAKIMKEYLLKTLGYEEQKVFTLVNATASEMRKELKKVEEIFARLPSGVESEILFYYAGHGYPDETTKIPYLIPVDVSATDIQNAIRLSEVTQRLGSLNAKRVTIILDACFTGDGRNAGLLAARTARIKPKAISLQGNMVVFSASSGDQTALPYKEKKHGYFTYFILKKLQETKGNVTYRELIDYVTSNVQLETTIKVKPQDPQVSASEEVINTWKNWRMK